MLKGKSDSLRDSCASRSLVVPTASKVTIFTLVEELYEGTEFAGTEQIVSATFPKLTLITEPIIWAGVIPSDPENQ